MILWKGERRGWRGGSRKTVDHKNEENEEHPTGYVKSNVPQREGEVMGESKIDTIAYVYFLETVAAFLLPGHAILHTHVHAHIIITRRHGLCLVLLHALSLLLLLLLMLLIHDLRLVVMLLLLRHKTSIRLLLSVRTRQ
jgi:hypothetical protein